ncbi:hypothetical protein H6G33_31220 [Calothrix sp. FACHB-1219]|uniref:hypothetical protein n=1 Tax=unclassified Calothrix TaxID=2619626 RepID=UPI00168284C3|nr:MULTISPECIES: hypothetical protein [unclassified Calothrix]MBD2206947.1 hypothetical protein [Calothrix sp. FACHB-168]MBD2221445.1 hypothetical protein [Calothrix sp. FACHB-1219]
MADLNKSIKIKKDTYLKIKPVNSSELIAHEKFFLKAGTTLSIISRKSSNKHLIVTLKDKKDLGDKNEQSVWYISAEDVI